MIQASITAFLATHSPAKLNEIHWHLTVVKSHKISKRELRAVIAELVQEGKPIISNYKGYTLVPNLSDIQVMEQLDKGIANLSSYIMKLLERRRALKKTRERMTAKLIPQTI